MAVAHDATASGDTTATNITDGRRVSWSHTATGSERVAIAALNIWYTPSIEAPETYTRTATYGGNTMTSIGTVQSNDTDANGWIEFWYLLNPPTGSQTVQIDVVRSGETFEELNIGGNSLSYTGVGSVGSPVIGFGTEAGTAMSQTIGSATGHMVVAAFVHANGSAITSYSGTSRFTTLGGTGYPKWVVGDAAGASPDVTVTATRADGFDYGEFGFDLAPPASSGFFLFF